MGDCINLKDILFKGKKVSPRRPLKTLESEMQKKSANYQLEKVFYCRKMIRLIKHHYNKKPFQIVKIQKRKLEKSHNHNR